MILLLCPKGFTVFEIKSPVSLLLMLYQTIRWATYTVQRARSFNIMSRVASATGESILISSFHCNGSDMGFLDVDSFLFTLEMSGEAVSPLWASSEQLQTLMRQPLPHVLLPLPRTDIHPPRSAHTCLRHLLPWHWPTPSNSDLKTHRGRTEGSPPSARDQKMLSSTTVMNIRIQRHLLLLQPGQIHATLSNSMLLICLQ